MKKQDLQAKLKYLLTFCENSVVAKNNKELFSEKIIYLYWASFQHKWDLSLNLKLDLYVTDMEKKVEII